MAGSFARDMRRFATAAQKDIDRQVRGITLALFKSIVVGTPVDTGRARGNWQTSIGQPVTGTVERLDPSGARAVADIVDNMSGAGGVSWLSNNLPYIATLEYGGYPDGPNTIGGFSKQAPQGMVRVNFARVTNLLKSGGGKLPGRR